MATPLAIPQVRRETRGLARDRQRRRKQPILTFDDDLHPHKGSVYACTRWFEKKAVVTPAIEWPNVSHALWRNGLRERRNITNGIKGGRAGAEYTVEWLRDLDGTLDSVRRTRTEAAKRIPRMWRAMSKHWGVLLPERFEETLYSYLMTCNAHVLHALHGLQRKDSQNLFPLGSLWNEMMHAKQGSWADIYQYLFQSGERFFIARLSRTGTRHLERDIYAPESIVLKEWNWLLAPQRHPFGAPSLVSKFAIPQIEYSLIGSDETIEYGEISIRRILDDQWQEVSSLESILPPMKK
jgi:hypothetical protein